MKDDTDYKVVPTPNNPDAGGEETSAEIPEELQEVARKIGLGFAEGVLEADMYGRTADGEPPEE